MLSRPAHLPNSLVRLAPDGFEVIKKSAPDCRRPQAVQTGLKYCVGDFTVDIELELRRGGIANTHGTRAIEPGELRHLPFAQASLLRVFLSYSSIEPQIEEHGQLVPRLVIFAPEPSDGIPMKLVLGLVAGLQCARSALTSFDGTWIALI